MKDDVRKAIIDVVKGSILLVLAGIVFYCVYPKYTFIEGKANFFKGNVFTGEITIAKNYWVSEEK